MVKGGKNFQEHLEHFVSEQKRPFQVQKSHFEVVLGWVDYININIWLIGLCFLIKKI